jgi:hypothetical protein
MIGEIYKGESVPLSFPVEDENGAVDLTGVTIEVKFTKGEDEVIKPASLVNGEGYILIDSVWFADTGMYTIQPKFTFQDGKTFFGKPQTLYIVQPN